MAYAAPLPCSQRLAQRGCFSQLPLAMALAKFAMDAKPPMMLLMLAEQAAPKLAFSAHLAAEPERVAAAPVKAMMTDV